MTADIELKWEWPANRATESKLLIQIDKVKKQGSGLFGVLKSPSLVDGFPDPQELTGNIVNANSSLNGKSVKLVLPLLEIEGIKAGSYAMLGIIKNTTCICIVPVDNKDADLNAINCP